MTEFQVLTHNLSEDAISLEHDERAKELYVYADVTSSFIILVGVFFPSVTGKKNCRESGIDSWSIPIDQIVTLASQLFLVTVCNICATSRMMQLLEFI